MHIIERNSQVREILFLSCIFDLLWCAKMRRIFDIRKSKGGFIDYTKVHKKELLKLLVKPIFGEYIRIIHTTYGE